MQPQAGAGGQILARLNNLKLTPLVKEDLQGPRIGDRCYLCISETLYLSGQGAILISGGLLCGTGVGGPIGYPGQYSSIHTIMTTSLDHKVSLRVAVIIVMSDCWVPSIFVLLGVGKIMPSRTFSQLGTSRQYLCISDGFLISNSTVCVCRYEAAYLMERPTHQSFGWMLRQG